MCKPVTDVIRAIDKTVMAPSVGESKVNMECEIFNILPLTGFAYTLIVGCVGHIRIDQSVLAENGRINAGALAPMGRLVGDAYCRVSDVFTLDRSALR